MLPSSSSIAPRVVIGVALAFTAVAARAGEAIGVFVSIQPQVFIVERIGGSHVTVDVLVPPGKSPHTYSPSPHQMTHLARSAVLFRIGMPFEMALTEKVRDAMPNLKVLDMHRGIARRQIEAEHGEHGDGHEESPDGLDPHVWLAPRLLQAMGRNVAETLSLLKPDAVADFETNRDIFSRDMEALDVELTETLVPLKGMTFYVYHPVFGYFADAYGLKQRAIEMEGKTPSPRQLGELIRNARAENVKIVFVQPEFDVKNAEAVAESIGGRVIQLNPLARDVPANLREISRSMRDAMVQQGPAHE